MFNFFKKKPKSALSFNALDESTWELASDKVAKAKELLNKPTNPDESNDENLTDEPQNETFDPRNPETYRFATNKPLVIDGIAIYNEYDDEKEPVTEKAFVQEMSMSSKIQKKTMAWEKAIELAKQDFRKRGIDKPGQSTPGYDEQVNEHYQSILNDSDFMLTDKLVKEYVNSYIKQRILECTPKVLVNHGGYGFSEAQLEVLDGLDAKIIKQIGKILSSNESGSVLKQKIFNSLAIDGLWVVELRHHEPRIEENIMHDYYIGFDDFDSKQEVYDFFASRPYLKNRPELKQKIIEDIIKSQFEGD
jgi:hypothetical protein